MDIQFELEELMILQGALVNVKMVLSHERKVEAEKLRALVDEAYEIVMNKIDSGGLGRPPSYY